MEKSIIITKGLEQLALSLALQVIKNNILVDILAEDSAFVEPFNSGLISFKKFDISNKIDIDQLVIPSENIKYIFIVIGVFLEKDLIDVKDDEIQQLYDLHFLNPIRLLRKFYNYYNKSTHLVIIGSCSAWRIQKKQTIYTAIRSAQTTFTRNLAPEIATQIPGSKMSLINLAGIKTPEMYGKVFGEDADFMHPDKVAELVIEIITQQQSIFNETQIMRKKPVIPGSNPIIIHGPCIPEIYQGS